MVPLGRDLHFLKEAIPHYQEDEELSKETPGFFANQVIFTSLSIYAYFSGYPLMQR